MTLLISGWVAIDEVETPFGKTGEILGGPASYSALAASLFTDVRLLAGVGQDFPSGFRATLDRPRIDLTGLTAHDAPTSRWGARYHYDMNTRDTLYTEVGVNLTWEPILPVGWDDSTGAFMAASHPAVQRQLITSLPALRASLVDTIAFYVDSALDDLRETMRVATFATVNEMEARQIANTPSIATAGRKMLADGARGLIVKLGEYGAVFMSSDDYFFAPGFPLEEVVDPTGAGDTFGGGFMGYLDTVPRITPAEVRRAMVYGSTVASFVVEDYGVRRLTTLTRSEVDERYRQFRALTHFDVAE